MTYIPGQYLNFEGVEYVVRTVDEILDGSDIPGVPHVKTIAVLDAVDGTHQTAIHILNSDTIELLEEAK